MKLKLIAALAIAVATPALAFASPSCTTEPKSKWMSEDAMKASKEATSPKGSIGPTENSVSSMDLIK